MKRVLILVSLAVLTFLIERSLGLIHLIVLSALTQ